VEEERIKPYVPTVDYWILGTDPQEYSYEDLERESSTAWSGVTDYLALKFLRDIDAGDFVLVCHTGDEPELVGIARVISDPYPDPTQDDASFMAFDLEPVRRLESPVALAELAGDPDFAEIDPEDLSEFAVLPVSARLWERILELAREHATLLAEGR
jgi:predicted RNA-binding protein with PUA-like domain